MINTAQHEVAIKAIISNPREAEVGQTYLMTVDVEAVSDTDEWDWPYTEEEYALYCILDTEPLFTHEMLGKPVIILHRFGGTYGPATFLLTANNKEQNGEMRVHLLKSGLVVQTLQLGNISLVKELQHKGKLVQVPKEDKPLPVTSNVPTNPPMPPLAFPEGSIRIPYHPNLYVPREEAESEVQKWLTGNGRLLTITSPPATGKSWLLRRIREEFLPGMPSFWLDVREFLTPAEDSPIGSRKIDDKKLAQWLTQFLREAQETCPDVPKYDVGVETALLLEKFAEAIQQFYPDQPVYLLVEGGDEPTEEAWHSIERNILERIARQTNWRFIIVVRLEQRLNSYMLRRDEMRLVLGSISIFSDAGRQQIERLRAATQNRDLPDSRAILSVLPGYPWSHSGLNSFLFLEVAANYQRHSTEWLGEDSGLRGLQAITGLPLEYVNRLYTYLLAIINQPDADWKPDYLTTVLGWSISESWEAIEELRSAGLVENVARNRFKITDGVREFVRETSKVQLTLKLRAFLSNADKIGLQRFWPTVNQTLLQDIENYDWLAALVDFSLQGKTPDVVTFALIAKVWTTESAGAYICADTSDKTLFDLIPLGKVANPTLRNHLIQTQRGRLPLQDWPPDIPLPPDAIARSPLGNTPLFLTLRKDPLLHSRAEDELSSLFGLGAFWIEHPLYARIATATQSQIVCGGRGNGRTALARALCYYEPQYQRHYWVYLPIFAVQPTMEYDVRSGLAEQLLQYVLSKPTLLSMLPEAGRSLLGQLLAQALSPTYVLAKVEQALSQGRWFRQADSAQQDIWRMVGKTHLEMLAQCLHDEVRLPMTQWARACRECFVTLGFRGLRLVLDVAGASPEAYAALKVELNAWQQAGVAATIFLPDNGLVTWQQNDIGRQTLALDWSEEQLGALLAHRFRKLSRRDPEAFFTEKAERDFLKAVKTPREMADLWYAILHSVDSWPKNALILSDHVARGVAQLQPSVQKKPEVTLITDDEQVGLIGQQPNPQKIHEVIGLMRGSFSLEEIRGLCASLGVDYEELGGENIRSAKVRELVDYMVRRKRFPDLLEMLKRERPSIPW